MKTVDDEQFRQGLTSCLAGILSYLLGIWIAEHFHATSRTAVVWLILDLTPPVAACVLGAGVLWRHCMGRRVASRAAIVLAVIGLFLGGFWLFVGFTHTPRGVIPVP